MVVVAEMQAKGDAACLGVSHALIFAYEAAAATLVAAAISVLARAIEKQKKAAAERSRLRATHAKALRDITNTI